MKRTSEVGFVKVNSLQFSSILHVGDARELTPQSLVFAVQREIPNFLGDEGDFKQFPIFQMNTPANEAVEPLQMNIVQVNPSIQVDSVHILGMSVSPIFQIGSNLRIDCYNRTLNIRQLLPRPKEKPKSAK